MTTRIWGGAAALALTLSLAACSAGAAPTDSGRTPDTAPVATEQPTPTPTPTEDAGDGEFGPQVTSARGNLIKDVGQLAGLSSADGETVVARFVVTDIVLDPACTSGYVSAPQNGHFLGIHLNVETTPELINESYPAVSFTQYDWQAYDAEGKRLNDPNGNAYSCRDTAEELPMSIGPGQSVSGWITLDVAATNGIVVLAPGGSPVGWEWSY